MKKQDLRLLFTGIFIAIILMIALFTSCTTQRDIEKVCSSGLCPTEVIIQHDTSYIERIDTIYRMSAWDSLLFVSSLNPEKIIDTVIIEDQFWKGQFIISKNDFKAQISHLQDSITQIVKTVEKTANNSEIKTVEVKVPVNVPKYNKFFYFLLIWFIVCIIILIIFALSKWQKLKLKWFGFVHRE